MPEKTTLTSKIDGFALPALSARPIGEPIGGVVVIQEIFGLTDHIGEMCEVFYTSPYFHIGSDEVFAGRVNLNPGYKDFMKTHNLKNDYELETYFVRAVGKSKFMGRKARAKRRSP